MWHKYILFILRQTASSIQVLVQKTHPYSAIIIAIQNGSKFTKYSD